MGDQTNFDFLDIKTFKILYTALVRPHVEYANIQLMHSFEVDIMICQPENSDVH